VPVSYHIAGNDAKQNKCWALLVR